MVRFDLIRFFLAFRHLVSALPITIGVGVLAMGLGLFVGTLTSLVIRWGPKSVGRLLSGYVSFFRGTPLMVQLFLFFFGLPQLLPFLGHIGAFPAAVLVMGLNAGAYVSETARSAIGSIDTLQWQAADASGFSRLQTLRYIIFPQALRVALPPLGNTFINVIQGTALTFMLGLPDLMGVAKMRAAVDYRFFENYLAVGLVYWVITRLVGLSSRKLELAASRGWEVS